MKLEKVGPTLIRFLQKSLVSYFHSDLLYHLYYQKISRVNGLFWSFTHVCLPISLRGLSKGVFERLNINRKWAFCLLISLRSKRFQSSYCVKVRAGAKKKLEGGGEGRSFLLSPPPPPSFLCFFALVPTFSTNSCGNACYAAYLLICLEAAKFVLLSVFTLIETICLKICKLISRVFSFSKPRSPWGRDRTKIKTLIINGSYPACNISP